jgi:DNA invertase Pin-like site-specific DNA recombinase
MTGTKLKTKAQPPENRRLGYARVSTYGQTLDSQLEQPRAAGCTAKIYREKVTGAHNDRRELLKMLKALAPGEGAGTAPRCRRSSGLIATAASIRYVTKVSLPNR